MKATSKKPASSKATISKKEASKKMPLLKIVKNDEWLTPYQEAIVGRHQHALTKIEELTQGQQRLAEFAMGHHFFGLHRSGKQWIFREWAPNATQIFLVGDFNNWEESSEYELTRVGENGNWEIKLPAKSIHHHWQNGERTGEGVTNFANGDKYTGRFLNGEQSGQGTYIWKGKATYTGQWKADKPDGKGVYKTKAGDDYDGTWKNGMMDGEGILHTEQGERYKGQFKDNQKHGSCIEITADGTRFEGAYDRGERHGNFTEYDKNGNKIAAGSYNHGRRTETFRK